jgi:DNA-binding transcriptional LysR family regulator
MHEQFDWNALQSFLAVVRCGRLTTAARQLGIDHSTLSRRIVELEASLQVQLFNRQPSGYSLTSQGERLLDAAQAMETTAIGILSNVAGSSKKIAGTVRIGARDGFGTNFLAPRLGRLAELHPDLQIQLVTLPRIFSLSKREADIAIGLAPPAEGRLQSRKLTDYELGLYGSQDYCARYDPIVETIDLKRHRFIGYIQDLIHVPELDYLPLVSRDIRPFFASSNLLVQLQAVLHGYGLCVLPCFMADPDPRLTRVLKQKFSLKRSFHMITHSDIRNLARIQIILDFIAQEVASARSLFVPGRRRSQARPGILSTPGSAPTSLSH